MKTLIIGGVAGGATAAARLRRLDEKAEIIIFERGEYISFANCGLPYYIGGVIEEREMLLVQSPEKMKANYNIDVRLKQEVVSLNRDEKKVRVEDLRTEATYEESYDYIILSPGANPIRPPIPGIENPGIFTLRNMADVDAIKGYIDNCTPEKAVVIGGGFIGIEMAENLHYLGMNVAIVEMIDQLIAPLDYEMASLVHGHILSKGVHLYLKDGVQAFEDNDGSLEAVLASGKRIPADLVIMAVGVKPEVGLAKEAGLQLGDRGGIKVDESFRTSDPHIFAIGDAVEVKDLVGGESTLIPLAGPANKQGRIAANNIAGIEEKYKGTQGTAIAKVFDLTVAATGNNEKGLQRRETQYLSTITQSKSHAGYYPGALPMTMKLLYASSGAILGAQIVGYNGVDKRIDVLAAVIRFNKSVYDLQELELAYAPPYSSAKDPVNIAGFVAANHLSGQLAVAHWHELEQTNSLILDVGTAEEREISSIEGSVHIPLGELRNRLNELPRDKEIIIYCQIGLRAYIASCILKQKGFSAVRVLSGGIKHYQATRQAQNNLDNQDYEYDSHKTEPQDLLRQEIYSNETGDKNPDRAQPGEIL
ncbi:MAG: FAD-dependent oxidoreductase [Bacillota bacterium]|nr:FAD-dependent oxidoreductase [Bacillota bacterium]MDW7685349.1 FAD-dependent oxidoreductase [Bacillota bacterium]